MITSALVQLAADFCGDKDQTRNTPAKYLSNANLAQQQFAIDTKALVEDASFTSAVGVATTDLPSDFMLEESVIYNGLPLTAVTRRDLAILYPDTDWTALTGTPKLYMIDPEEANKKLRFIPIPAESKSGVLRFYPLPADVANGTDVILNASTLMSRFHMAVAAFTAWLTLAGETMTPEIDAKMRKMIAVYSDGVTKAIDTYGNTKSAPMRLRPK